MARNMDHMKWVDNCVFYFNDIERAVLVDSC